jgi:hypothetical protein
VRRLAAAVLGVALVVGLGRAHAQPAKLDPADIPKTTDAPEVVVLTFGVGARIFEKFGHAAICLNYKSVHREPVCFNYGVTDFGAGPIMIWDFLRSQQKFWVEPESWGAMTYFYRKEDRDIWMQVLPLTDDQARAIEHQVGNDIDEANRYYIYDHFFDNCTTRVRDMIDRATGGKLRDGADAPYPLTFRQIGRRGLAELPPLIALADFVLGRQLDDTPTIWDAMFHPDVLRERVAVAFGVEPRLVYKRQGRKFAVTGPTDRFNTFALALVFAVPLLVATWRRRFVRVAVAWSTLYLTFWGVVIWALVILSSIPGVRWNEAVLVLVPFDVVLPLLGADRRRRYARARVIGLLAVSALTAIGVFHQPLWIPILTAIMPLAIIAFELPHPLLRRPPPPQPQPRPEADLDSPPGQA